MWRSALPSPRPGSKELGGPTRVFRKKKKRSEEAELVLSVTPPCLLTEWRPEPRAAAMAAGAAKLGLPLVVPHRSSIPSPVLRRPRRPVRFGDSSYGRKAFPHAAAMSAVEAREWGGERLAFTDPEVRLVEGLLGVQGRGRSATPRQLKDVEQAVEALEQLEGVPDPTSSGLIEGRWQLIFTTRPGTASPIQRTFVGVDVFNVFQEVYLRTDDPRVSNIVQFSNSVGELKVELTNIPRRSDYKTFAWVTRTQGQSATADYLHKVYNRNFK